MSILAETTLLNVRKQEARKLFGFVVSKDPDELYDRVKRPRVEALPHAARHDLSAEYATTHGYESDAQDLLLFGLADTQTFVLNILKHHPHIPFDRAVDIAQHERTVQALALVARQSSPRSTELIEHPHEAYDLSPDAAAIELHDSITPALVNGCPAIEVVDGDVEPWPIFNRFVPWAARLALISHYDHKED